MASLSPLEDLLKYDEWKIPLLDAIRELQPKLAAEFAKGNQIYPPQHLIFNALNQTLLSEVKVVILGQDPYPGFGQAMGLSFSVPVGVKIPQSLNKMYTELERDIPGFNRPNHGCLVDWARQGVLMINAALTVEANNPESHAKIW